MNRSRKELLLGISFSEDGIFSFPDGALRRPGERDRDSFWCWGSVDPLFADGLVCGCDSVAAVSRWCCPLFGDNKKLVDLALTGDGRFSSLATADFRFPGVGSLAAGFPADFNGESNELVDFALSGGDALDATGLDFRRPGEGDLDVVFCCCPCCFCCGFLVNPSGVPFGIEDFGVGGSCLTKLELRRPGEGDLEFAGGTRWRWLTTGIDPCPFDCVGRNGGAGPFGFC